MKNGQGEISRLINVVVVSPTFCDLLLKGSAAALAAGHGGEAFHLTPEEQEWALSIQATTPAHFAERWVDDRNGKGNDR